MLCRWRLEGIPGTHHEDVLDLTMAVCLQTRRNCGTSPSITSVGSFCCEVIEQVPGKATLRVAERTTRCLSEPTHFHRTYRKRKAFVRESGRGVK